MKSLKRSLIILPALAILSLILIGQRLGAQSNRIGNGEASFTGWTVLYQGYLTDKNGQPLNSKVKLEFFLYDSPVGSVIWDELHDDVRVLNGNFSVQLGSINPLNPALFLSEPPYLQIIVHDGLNSLETDFKPLGTVPHAMISQYATEAGHAQTASMADYATTASTANFANEAGHATSADEADHAVTADSAGHAVKADTAAKADHATTADTASSVDWSGVTGIPNGLEDGDDDTLATTTCADGQVIKFEDLIPGWICATDLTASFSAGNIILVAKAGGDFNSIQLAIDSVVDASSVNPYLVLVGPGLYEESVTLKPHVHVQGSGQGVTIISSTDSNYGPIQVAAVVLASNTSLRHMTLRNSGNDNDTVALLATAGITNTLVAQLTAEVNTSGAWVNNYALYVTGPGTELQLEQVSGLAQVASYYNVGLYADNGTSVVIRDSSFAGREGAYAYGIYATGAGTTIWADQVDATGIGGTNINSGAGFLSDAAANLAGGTYSGLFPGVGIVGSESYGLEMSGAGASLVTIGVTANAEGSNYNYGLLATGQVQLVDSSFSSRYGWHSWGIFSAATLYAEDVLAQGAEANDFNYGLMVASGSAELWGGHYNGQGPAVNVYGIYSNPGLALLATDVEAAAQGGSFDNYSLYNNGPARLIGGLFLNGLRVGPAGDFTGQNLTVQGLLQACEGPAEIMGSLLDSVDGCSGLTLSHSRILQSLSSPYGSPTCILVSWGPNLSSGTTCPAPPSP